MRPSNEQPGELMHPEPGATAPVGDAVPVQRSAAPPRVSAPQTVVVPAPATPPEIAGMLLPTEYISFSCSPHPIVLVRPVVEAVVILIALAVLLSWQTHPIVRGHHVTVPLVGGAARTAVLAFAGLVLLRQAASFVQRLFHYLAFKIVTTNRRVFVVQGLFGRRVTPIGNTALAGATMSQGFFGRMLGFGDLVMPLASSGPGLVRGIRDPVRLYRECEAVANGVEGDEWKQPIRQTIIP